MTSSISTDLYSLAVSAFEILSNLASPWVGTLPVLNDALLLQALTRGERPRIDQLR